MEIFQSQYCYPYRSVWILFYCWIVSPDDINQLSYDWSPGGRNIIHEKNVCIRFLIPLYSVRVTLGGLKPQEVLEEQITDAIKVITTIIQ